MWMRWQTMCSPASRAKASRITANASTSSGTHRASATSTRRSSRPAARRHRRNRNEIVDESRSDDDRILLVAPQQALADDVSGNDLRDIRIGLAVTDLPSAGYVDFFCAADANVKPSGWSAWRDCPAGADGLRALRFG